ncbi:MAG: UDP-N-acetylmuramate dehydrogenase [Candidatus Vogelbacteria bacterium]|nr:UDP-N-acetylmuramate dehydrogenase [Candidatus Vogelbacteria bacterium]
MKNIWPNLQTNIDIKTLTTFGVGGTAAFYLKVTSPADLLTVMEGVKKIKVPYLVMAGGSNLVFADKKLNKLLIHVTTSSTDKEAIKITGKQVVCQVGVPLAKLIDLTLKNNLAGLEALSGIPGTVGGAIVGNAGAYGQTISDRLDSVDIFDGKKVRTLTKGDCRFSYRDSILKHKEWIVLTATFSLERGDKKLLLAKSKSIIKTRNAKYPPGLKCPGSFFKNVLVKKVSKESLKKIDQSKIIDGKIPTGYLLEVIGARGMKQGGVYIPEYHGNLLVNDGTGTYKDVISLAKKLKTKVKKQFGIELEEEVRYML